MSLKRLVVFGGNGFVGSKVLEKAIRLGSVKCVSVSRSGKMPVALQSTDWAAQVEWKRGDALESDTYNKILKDSDAVVVTVGSPPLPTKNQIDMELQITQNGTTCETVIKTAREAGVGRVVLLSAEMPSWAPKGYRDGKTIAFNAAADFCKGESDGVAVVLKPAAIYGTRFLESGTKVPLGVVMGPISKILSGLQSIGISGALERAIPSVFKGVLDPFVPVEKVADAALYGAVSEELNGAGLVVYENSDLLNNKFYS